MDFKHRRDQRYGRLTLRKRRGFGTARFTDSLTTQYYLIRNRVPTGTRDSARAQSGVSAATRRNWRPGGRSGARGSKAVSRRSAAPARPARFCAYRSLATAVNQSLVLAAPGICQQGAPAVRRPNRDAVQLLVGEVRQSTDLPRWPPSELFQAICLKHSSTRSL